MNVPLFNCDVLPGSDYMEHRPTVFIESVDNHPTAVWLRWERWVVEADVRPAFHEMTHRLDTARQPVHVLVDLRADPRLPLQTTISETLSGPFMHPNMGEWLVIGTNARAHFVADMITRVGRQNSIRWFQTDTEAFEHLSGREASQIQACE
jgi:hypothetical protein